MLDYYEEITQSKTITREYPCVVLFESGYSGINGGISLYDRFSSIGYSRYPLIDDVTGVVSEIDALMMNCLCDKSDLDIAFALLFPRVEYTFVYFC